MVETKKKKIYIYIYIEILKNLHKEKKRLIGNKIEFS